MTGWKAALAALVILAAFAVMGWLVGSPDDDIFNDITGGHPVHVDAR
jgi:hypothetical protein